MDDLNIKWWLRTGGLAGLVLGLAYLLITAVYISQGALPSGIEEQLMVLAGRTPGWWVILGLSVFTDILFLLVALALYLALQAVHQNAMLAGSGLLALFVILDLAVTWPNYAALFSLSGSYAAAPGEIQRAAVVGAASYAAAVLNSALFGVYAILVPALGILIISLVMLKGPFTRLTAYFGLGAGLLGVIAVVGPFFSRGLGLFAVFSSVLTTIWVLLSGYRLYRLGQR